MQLVKDSWFDRQGYSSVIIKVDDQDNIDKVADSVKVLGYGANTAKLMLEEINKILTMVGAVLAVIGGISLFVAAIGIINTMIMATYERTREIGVLRACGATKGTISRLFTFEAAMLGFWGGVFGMTISFILGTVAKFIVQHNPASAMSNIPISEIGNFPLWLILSVLAFTTLIGMLSGLYPAHRAAKLNPVEALRYE
jgi:putative ABC transport system permease protein